MPIQLTKSAINELVGAPTPLEVVQEMVNAYKKDFRKMGDDEMKRRHKDRPHPFQSSCMWLSVSELLELISHNNATGIRIYFGQHTKGNFPSGDKDYEDLLAPIFVATIDKINPGNPTSENSEDQLIVSDSEKEASNIIVAGAFAGKALDQVPLCNPKCPDKTMMKITI